MAKPTSKLYKTLEKIVKEAQSRIDLDGQNKDHFSRKANSQVYLQSDGHKYGVYCGFYREHDTNRAVLEWLRNKLIDADLFVPSMTGHEWWFARPLEESAAVLASKAAYAVSRDTPIELHRKSLRDDLAKVILKHLRKPATAEQKKAQRKPYRPDLSREEVEQMGYNDALGNILKKPASEQQTFAASLLGARAEAEDGDGDPYYCNGVSEAAEAFLGDAPLAYRGPEWITAGMLRAAPIPESRGAQNAVHS